VFRDRATQNLAYQKNVDFMSIKIDKSENGARNFIIAIKVK
jgi:hypothetical protein